MKRIKIWNDEPSSKQLEEICREFENGGVAVLPTDTLYGIVCDAMNPKAIEKVCRIKGLNPEKNNLSIICADISMASEYARIDNDTFRLMRDNTPGAFTFLLKSASILPRAFKERKTVGIRIPASNLARKIAGHLGRPLLTTSIRFEDDDHAINPDLIAESYEGKADLFIEGDEGTTQPSTIIDCQAPEPEIIRQGAAQLI